MNLILHLTTSPESWLSQPANPAKRRRKGFSARNPELILTVTEHKVNIADEWIYRERTATPGI